jgi:AbrB family looped-hinge helix DNA binding protein
MQTKLSTKGQVVLPSRVRRQLRLQPGDPLGVKLEGQTIILIPKAPRKGKARMVKDPITGLPVLDAGVGAPLLTSEEVDQILADFP